MLTDKTYKIKCSSHKLETLGCFCISNCKYIYRFPLYYYKNNVIIEGKFTIDTEENILWFDVYDKNFNIKYQAFYNNYNKYDPKFLNSMYRKIKHEFDKFGIKLKGVVAIE